MLEAKFGRVSLFKKLVDALKELVNDVNFEFSDEGLSLQAMDASHVSLCKLLLDRDYFESFRCDITAILGLNLTNLSKVLKCARDDDTLTLKHKEDDSDRLTLIVENEKQNKFMDFEMKLLEINKDNLGIPDGMQYSAHVKMSSAEFAKIIRDLSALGDHCLLGCSEDGFRFAVEGEIGQANIVLKGDEFEAPEPMETDIKEDVSVVKGEPIEVDGGDENVVKAEDIEVNDAEEKQVDSPVKAENVIDSDVEIEEKENIQSENTIKKGKKKRIKPDVVVSDSEDELDDGPIDNKKKKGKSDDSTQKTTIMCAEPVEAPFAIRYLKIFVQATSLCPKVKCCLMAGNPLMIEYPLVNAGVQSGYLRYYLAPKVDQE
eukprot:maker-scaffold_9-snap-gene-2.62-mRNA-1 protein AED:0.01 eAED:0.01 QI:237/1/1/1/1/1/2/76/373